MLTLAILLICVTITESHTLCQEHFTSMINQVDFVLQANSNLGDTHPVSLVCGVKNVTLVKSPSLWLEYKLNPGKRIDWAFENCLDNHTLVFTTDGSPKSRLTGRHVHDLEEIVVAILCLSSFPILFNFDGGLPQWDLIFEQDYHPKKEIYLSTIYIPYMPDKTGNYSFSSGEDDVNHSNKWFYIYFTGATKFVPNPWTVADPVMIWEDDNQSLTIPCRITHPNLSQFVVVVDPQENVICSPCNVLSKGIQISDPVLMERIKVLDYVFCIFPEGTGDNSRKITTRVKVLAVNHGQRNIELIDSNAVIRKIPNEHKLVCLAWKGIHWSKISTLYVPSIAEIGIRRNCLDESSNCSSKSGVPLYPATTNTVHCRRGETCSISLQADRHTDLAGIVRCDNEHGNVTTEAAFFQALDEELYFVNDWKLGLVAADDLAHGSKLWNGKIACFIANFLYMPIVKLRLTFFNGTEEVVYTEALSEFGKRHVGRKFGVVWDWLDNKVNLTYLKRSSCEARARIPIQGTKGIEVVSEHWITNGNYPKVLSFTVDKLLIPGEHMVFLNCSVSGDPKPTIRFEKDDKELVGPSAKVEWSSKTDTYHAYQFVQRSPQEMFGFYRCLTENSLGAKFEIKELVSREAESEQCISPPHQTILDAAHITDKESKLHCSESASLSCSCACDAKRRTSSNCRCPIPKDFSTEDETYIAWPTFSVAGEPRIAQSNEICHLSGQIDCSDDESVQCKTRLTSRVGEFLTSTVFSVEKRRIKPVPQTYSDFKNKTQSEKVCSIQRTISDTLCHHLDPNREIQQMNETGLHLLFPLLFGDLICNCSVVVREGRKDVLVIDKVDGQQHKVDELSLPVQNDTVRYVTISLAIAFAMSLAVIGILLYRRHLRIKATLEQATQNNTVMINSNSREQTGSVETPLSLLKPTSNTEKGIWISPQPLQLISKIPLGIGYYGKVYKARHTLLEEPMAIKHILLHKALQACSWNVDLLLREIKHLRQVEHTNVVKFYHCWIEGPDGMIGLEESMGISQWTSTNDNYSFYIQMEFCDGTLDGWLKERPTKDERGQENITSIFQQVLQGLDAIHKKDIVHRDIKPNNVFWKDENGRIVWKVGDLGLSKKMEFGTERGENMVDDELSHVGNINYRSKEMVRELHYTYKTDIYSLGLVFLEIILPEFINTGKKVSVFKEIRESENLGSYLPLLLGPGENYGMKNEILYEILEGMLNSVPEVRIEIQDILKLLEGF